jgi:hypothetical protein
VLLHNGSLFGRHILREGGPAGYQLEEEVHRNRSPLVWI